MDLVYAYATGLPIGGVTSISKTPTFTRLEVLSQLVTENISIPDINTRITGIESNICLVLFICLYFV